jgi:hypothetical protein
LTSATPLIIPQKSQDGLRAFYQQCYQMLNQQWNIREMFRIADLAYIREKDWTQENLKAKWANRYYDPTKFQNVCVPVVMPQVESAVTYQSSVFLTGNPLFGWVAPPESEDSALQYQAIVEENSRRGGWIDELIMFFRDGFKYNLSFVEVSWGRQVTAALETDLTYTAGKQAKPKEVIWEGNTVKRWDPYNTFFDSRCAPTDLYKDGEFAGKTELMSRIKLKKFLNELPDKMVQNVVAAFESGLGTGAAPGPGGIESYYIPQINPDALISRNPKLSTDWMAWAGMFDRPQNGINYKNMYEVTTMYARILPSDFNLRVPAANTPQIWKFIWVNHTVLVYAERQTNAHDFLPVLVGQPNHDGLGFQTKSLANNATPFQDVASALVNSAMAARRRAISDRGIYNPLLISEAHINSDSPNAKIPLRPAAYGKPINEAYYSIPFKDDQSAVAFQELPQILQMANQVNGQNQARQGQFVKGNKTLHEYDSIMANASSRDQLCAMSYEVQVFTPLKEIIKTNTMQYQAGVSIYSPSQQRVVKVDPVQLRQSFATYTITDGLTPNDKVINGDDFTVALQTIGSSPQIGQGYNIAPMFSYLMKTRNVDLKSFEKPPEQVAYEQAAQQWTEVAQLYASKGQPFTIPQPTPQQFGYNPATQTPGANPPAAPNPVQNTNQPAPTPASGGATARTMSATGSSS